MCACDWGMLDTKHGLEQLSIPSLLKFKTQGQGKAHSQLISGPITTSLEVISLLSNLKRNINQVVSIICNGHTVARLFGCCTCPGYKDVLLLLRQNMGCNL